jgi:hypothetical protein
VPASAVPSSDIVTVPDEIDVAVIAIKSYPLLSNVVEVIVAVAVVLVSSEYKFSPVSLRPQSLSK